MVLSLSTLPFRHLYVSYLEILVRPIKFTANHIVTPWRVYAYYKHIVCSLTSRLMQNTLHCEGAWEQGYIIANLSLYPSLHLHADLQASTCAVASDCRPVCCLKLLYSWQRIVDGHWVIGIVVRNQTSAWVRFSYADEAWYWLKWNNPVLYRTSRPLFTDWEMWFIQW